MQLLRAGLLALVLISGHAFGQKFLIKGQVKDSLGTTLPSSTVMLLNPGDSSLVNFGVTNSQGIFEIKNVNKGTYLLKITFVGFEPLEKRFSTPDNGQVFDFGMLRMKPESKLLQGLTVVGEKAPVTVKRDTIEFNAGSFKTKANANVEDLLKKLPGVEVESDGSITAQGEQVQRVTVDGREFFGRDPKLATRNLPADAVEKVQIFDKKSEQSLFTGIDDGSKEKTVNLELKEEKRNAAFGNLMGGLGNEGRFQGKASINRFTKGKQLSFIGMGNNINEQGFSFDEVMNFSGNSQQMMRGNGQVRIDLGSEGSNQLPVNFGGRQNGIQTNYAGGLNLNQDFNKGKTKTGGSYFFSRLEQNIDKDLQRINYLPEDPEAGLPARSYLFEQQSQQNNTTEAHRANLTIDHAIDSANSIRFNAAASQSFNESLLSSQSKTFNVDGSLSNESFRKTFNDGQAFNINSSLLWRHRFEKKGRTFSANLTFAATESNSEGGQNSTNDFFGSSAEKRVIDQSNTQANSSSTIGATLSYTEPLGRRRYLELNHNYRTNLNDSDRDVFNLIKGNEVRDLQLSNEFNSKYVFNRPSLNFRVNRDKFNVTLGTGYQYTTLEGNLISRDTSIRRTFSNVMPVARFNYDFSSSRRLRFEYETNLREPSLQQLQPVIDNTDPLNISIGNPKLKPAYAHNLSLNFNSFNPSKFLNFFAFINATYQTNAITVSQKVDQRLVRTSIPVNVRDNLNVSSNLNLGFPIRKIYSRFNFGPTSTYFRSINVLNGKESQVFQQTLGGNVRYNFSYKEFINLDLSANLRNQKTNYEAAPQQDQEFLNQTYSAEANFTILKNWQLNTSYDYFIYDSRTTNFNQSIPILNVWISRFLLKGNSGELKIGVSNLLDKSLSVTQTSSANYLQQETINNLGRYLMVSFTYALNKQLNPMSGGPGGRRGSGMRVFMQRDQ
ncbi:MAG: TonB-dependent receptor family protein [Bacteroidetes bacterium]|nr:TonB-dependent receptor family protein [Bacteroidota bacterium]